MAERVHIPIESIRSLTPYVRQLMGAVPTLSAGSLMTILSSNDLPVRPPIVPGTKSMYVGTMRNWNVNTGPQALSPTVAQT